MNDDDARSHARAARYALAVLTAINLLNYLDRYVVSAVLESLRRSELHLSDVQLGSLGMAFMIVYMLTSPLFGRLGDRGKRPPLIAAGVIVWSLATALGGLARNFIALFSARAAVGIGEAAYGTIAPALLADAYPKERRGRVFSIFFAAIPIGTAAGYILGGFIDQHLGWRAAFFIAGAPGLLMALLAWRVRDFHPVVKSEISDETAAVDVYKHLLRNSAYVISVIGYAAYTFALGAVAYWMPAFLERERGVAPNVATVQFGLIVVITGFIGTAVGGWLGDYVTARRRNGYLFVCAISSLLAAPAALLAFTLHDRVAYTTAIVIAQLLLFMSTGPVNSALVGYVDPYERASAVALSIFAIHLFGDVPSPLIIGMLSHASSLSKAFLIIPVAIAISGALWLYAAFSIRRESR
jgi:MFS family permease